VEGQPLIKASATTGVSVTTNSEGVFTVPVAPGARHLITIEKSGVGRGTITLRPGCGLDLPKLVLTSKGVRAEPVRYVHGTEPQSSPKNEVGGTT